MARFARIDSQIRENQGSLQSERFSLNPCFANRASGGLKSANRRFEGGDSRESLTRYENRVSSANRFAQIDSRELP